MNTNQDNLHELLNKWDNTQPPEIQRISSKELITELASYFGFEIASIFILDKEQNLLWSMASSDNEDLKIDSRLGICGEAVKNKKTITVNNAYQDTRFYAKVDQRTGYRTKNIIVVPLINERNEVFGTLQFMNKSKGNISNKDKELVEHLAKQIVSQMPRRLDDTPTNPSMEQFRTNNRKLATNDIIGSSDKIQTIIRIIEQVSDTPINVLITGESGTGKELVARAIHFTGNWSGKPYIAVNCAAIPESLVESELFGVEKGVATGVNQRIGKFEEANGGTIFLDEIGDLSLTSQAKILRVLQDNKIQRVGSSKSINLELRVVSATNKDLQKEISKEQFREDLYYRLNVVQIKTPSLKEIPEDVVTLSNYFLSQYCDQFKKEHKKLSKNALQSLQEYTWPGNVRELQNLIKKLITLVPNRIIKNDHLPNYILSEGLISKLVENKSSKKLNELVEELERKVISETLVRNNFNQLRTSKVLGISRQGLINKIKKYSIEHH